LIEKVFDFTSYVPKDSFDITPSRLGLEMYERCKAGRIEPQSPPGESKSAHPSR